MAITAIALGALVLLAPAAGAHAVLQSTSIADGEVLAAAPEEVAFRFNEPVGVPRDGVRVYDASGERVDAGDAGLAEDDPAVARVGLPNDLAEGTYVATFRVTSADGHPVASAIVFSVGRELGASDELVAALLDAGGDRPFAVAMTVVRWLTYVAALAAAGGAVFLWRLRREIGEDRPRLVRIVRLAVIAGAVATVLTVPLQNALVTGSGLGGLVDGPGLAATLTSATGWSALLRLLGLAALWVAVAREADRVAVVAAALVAGSLLFEGHTLTSQPAWAVWLADAAHVGAAAVWVGGLLMLLPLLRRRRQEDDPVAAGRLVGGFSAAASLAVVTVAVAGVALGWVEVRALRALFSTSYGWTLVAKSALVIPVLGLGWFNNRRLVPALARSRRAATADPAHAWRLLRRTVTAEIAVLVAVLGVTAALVAIQPAAEAAGITGAYTAFAPLEGGDLEGATVNLTVDPNRVGANELHTYLLDASGRPADLADDVVYRYAQPALDIGPIEREPDVAGPGHHQHFGNELSVPGLWEITVVARIDRFTAAEATFEVVVNR